MNRHRSSIPCFYALLALLLLAAIAFMSTRADLPDPCDSSSTAAVTHVDDMAILLENSDSSRRRRAAVTDELLWPDGIVYYTIDPLFSGERSRFVVSCFACSRQINAPDFLFRRTLNLFDHC